MAHIPDWRCYDFDRAIRDMERELANGSFYVDTYGERRHIDNYASSLHWQIRSDGIRDCNDNEVYISYLKKLEELQTKARQLQKQHSTKKLNSGIKLELFYKKSFLYRLFHKKEKKLLTNEFEQIESREKQIKSGRIK